MIKNFEEIASIIDPKNGATNYLAAIKAKKIIEKGYTKKTYIPKVYMIERMIVAVNKKDGNKTTLLARAIHAELIKLNHKRVHHDTHAKQ